MELTAAALWLNTVFAGFDQSITLAVHNLYEWGGVFFSPTMEFISLLGKGGIALIILSLVLMFFPKNRRFGTAMAIGLAIGAICTNLFIKVAVARPRPYADAAGVYYPLWQMMGQHMESDRSFPSGHTTAAFASMIPLFALGNKKVSWLVLLFAFMMGISRIYLVVHFPSDVLGGIIVGTVAGILAVIIVKKIPERWYEMEFVKKPSLGKHEKQ